MSDNCETGSTISTFTWFMIVMSVTSLWAAKSYIKGLNITNNNTITNMNKLTEIQCFFELMKRNFLKSAV